MTVFQPISTFGQAQSNMLGQLLYISSGEANEVYNNIPTVMDGRLISNPSHDMITTISLLEITDVVCVITL